MKQIHKKFNSLHNNIFYFYNLIYYLINIHHNKLSLIQLMKKLINLFIVYLVINSIINIFFINIKHLKYL